MPVPRRHRASGSPGLAVAQVAAGLLADESVQDAGRRPNQREHRSIVSRPRPAARAAEDLTTARQTLSRLGRRIATYIRCEHRADGIRIADSARLGTTPTARAATCRSPTSLPSSSVLLTIIQPPISGGSSAPVASSAVAVREHIGAVVSQLSGFCEAHASAACAPPFMRVRGVRDQAQQRLLTLATARPWARN